MSENITHTAVTDDCARLCLHSPDICEAFKLCLREHQDLARLGGITRSGGPFMPSLLEDYREKWEARTEEDLLEQKLAFVLGWHFHRAADLQMKPVFCEVDGDCPQSPSDCSVYHDVFLFREVYDCGQVEPYDVRTLQMPLVSAELNADALEELFRSMWQRALIGIHTFIPDRDDVDGWMERVFRTRQRFTVDLRRYAEAFADPAPAKERRFLEGLHFYNRTDPLIVLARALQTGQGEGLPDLDEAVDQAAEQSLYARALRRGYLYVCAASRYFTGDTDQEAYKDVLERGKQGVH